MALSPEPAKFPIIIFLLMFVNISLEKLPGPSVFPIIILSLEDDKLPIGPTVRLSLLFTSASPQPKVKLSLVSFEIRFIRE